MNYKKLSQLAHVSVSTVSKAFSGSPDINSDTREHVFKVAKENGCFEKYYKNKYQRKVIAVICPEFYSKYYATFCESLQNKLLGYDAIALLSSTNFDAKIEQQLIEFYTTYAKVDGVIIISPRIENIEKNAVPMVAIGKQYENINSIIIGSSKAVLAGVEALIALGHAKIGYIGEKLTVSKKSLVCDAFEKSGLEVCEDYIYSSSLRFREAGADGAQHFLSLENMPTAIIAAYDDIAFGAISVFENAGLVIPDDISVIGMDNTDDCKTARVPLSSIESLSDEVADNAIELLFEQITNRNVQPKLIIEDAKLHLRNSVAEAKKG